jgi:hypothetical protein
MEQQQSPILQEHIILYVFRALRPDYSVYHLSGINTDQWARTDQQRTQQPLFIS